MHDVILQCISNMATEPTEGIHYMEAGLSIGWFIYVPS